MAGVGVGAAGGDLAASVVSFIRGNSQLVIVVVLAGTEICILVVCVAAHSSSPDLPLLAAVRLRLQRKHERGVLITASRSARVSTTK